jgi:hypothetical protein
METLLAASGTAETSSAGSTSLLPAEERFWQRYSPHHELPLACATSVFVYVVALVILAVGGLTLLFQASAESQKPASIDVMLIEGGEGFGGPGGSGGLPGLPGDPGRTEIAQGSAGPDSPMTPGAQELPELPTIPDNPLDVPPENAPTDPTLPSDVFKEIEKDAKKRSETPPTLFPKSGSGPKSGSSGAKGSGGQGGTGGKGGMPGGPGGGGRKATEQEIKAWRWRFDLTGGPKEHADKLDRAGLIVAVPADGNTDLRKGPHWFITDLKRRPVAMEKGDLAKYEDAVKWYNQKPDSLRGLAEELKIDVPKYVVLLLPKEREAKMAAEEKRFAKQNRMDVTKVQETWFDFRLKNGAYEAVAIMQK